MQDSTEERRTPKTYDCSKEQIEFAMRMRQFSEKVDKIDLIEMQNEILASQYKELNEKVDRHRRDFDNAYSAQREQVFQIKQSLETVSSTVLTNLGDVQLIKQMLEKMGEQLKPMVERETKIKGFILKWAVPVIFVLLLIIILDEKAKALAGFIKALI